MTKTTLLLCILSFFSLTTATQAQDIVINEIVTSNTMLNTDEDGSYQDWVELYNNGPLPVNLNGYGLTDDSAALFKWVFPNVTVNPGQHLLVFCSDKNRAVPGSELHTNWKISSGGETITLTRADGTEADVLPATIISQNLSYGRQPDGSENFVFFEDVTPGAANSATGYNGFLNPPVFSQAGGFFASGFNLTLSTADAGAVILYTLDGSEPKTENIGGTTYQYKNQYEEVGGQPTGPLLTQTFETLQYSAPIAIADRSSEPNKISAISSTYSFDPSYYIPGSPIFKGTVVRVKVVRPGSLPSKTISQTYFITPEGTSRFSIPVISLSVNENEFFDYEDGIYVAGKDFDDWRAENPTLNPRGLEVGNYYRRGVENERVANMTYFVNGAEVLNQDVGLRIRGASTRRYESKSLTVYARSDYGDETLSYKFFDRLPDNNFQRLTLSNSGSDFRNTMFRDALAHDICYELNVENEDYQPAITFINGEFWGILNIRERFDDKYFERVYGTDDVDLLENQGEEAEEGTPDHYQAMITYVQGHSLANPANFDYIKTQMDPESFMDYYISNIFFDNSDWPGNNTQFWRKRTASYEPNAPYGLDGRWRWIFHDMDDTFSFGTDDINHNNLAIATTLNSDWPNPEWSTLMLRKLLQNPTFKNDFINRFADLMNTSFIPSRMISKLNTMRGVIEPEFPEHVDRWRLPESMDDWEWYLNYEEQFANQRPGFQRNHIRQKFGIASNINATLDVSDAAHGYVKISTINIKDGTPGITGNPYPWTGIYFSNIPVKLKAIPNPGFVFSHWTGASTSTDAEIMLTPAASYSITAVFIPDPLAEVSEPIYFWFMGGAIPNDTPLTFLNSSFEPVTDAVIQYQSSLAGYPFTNASPFWRKGSMERRNSPTPINYRPEANGGAAYVAGNMKGLQITQPFQSAGLENTMVFNLPTVGYKKIKFSFAAIDEGAAAAITIDYAVNAGAPVWLTNGLAATSLPLTNAYQLFNADFSAIATADNNPDFKIRLRFTGPNMTADTGKRVTFNNIAVDAVPLPLVYPTPNVFTVGSEITPLTPATVGPVLSYSISPDLPDGLDFDTTTGIISGTPTAISATTTYTVTADYGSGTATFDVVITVNEAAPVDLSYDSPNVFTVGETIDDLIPTVTGTVDSYSVSPDLPDGLEIDSATGIISGTPTTATDLASYTVTASNISGDVTFDVVITVNEAAPVDLSYDSPNVFTVGETIDDLIPTVTGSVDSYSVSPDLPDGLEIDSATGIISGMPTTETEITSYTVTASNSGGDVTFDVVITVNEAAPVDLSYDSPNVFTVGETIDDLIPTVTGTVDSYSVSPDLPDGLEIDSATGVISGTPTTATDLASYTVTASNVSGDVTFDVVITVNEAAPVDLSYNSPNVFTVGETIDDLIPTVTGTVDSYSVSPDLPDGLEIDSTTGIISGTPTTATDLASYTVTASNVSGDVTFDVVITVNEAAPVDLSYDSPNVFTVGETIDDLIPSVTGTVDSYSVSPDLPDGLEIDTATGIISGTPTTATDLASYTVTASNVSGDVTFDVVITVNEAAPVDLSYDSPNVFTVGTAITALNPTVSGTIINYSVVPALPDGLSLDALTGVISGTPTTVTPNALYTVTAANFTGNTSFDVEITVNAIAPAGLSYNSPNVFTVGSTIGNLVPTVNGTIDSYSVSPDLPDGLEIDSATGVISGTPTTATEIASYTVTASNSGGDVTFDVVITVNDAAPLALSYDSPNVFIVGTSITALIPTVTGIVDSYSVSPDLPDGLEIDSVTGIISGTPTTATEIASYTVTASNSGGDVTFDVVITVEEELGVGENDNLNFTIYPNPFTDLVHVSGITADTTYALFSIDGRQLQNGRVSNDLIRFGSLPNGVYLLQLTTEGRSEIKKIIKK